MTTSIMRKKAAAILYNGMCSHINGIDIDQLLAFFLLLSFLSCFSSVRHKGRTRWANELSWLNKQKNGLNWTEQSFANLRPSRVQLIFFARSVAHFIHLIWTIGSTTVTINIIKWSSKPSSTVFISNFKCNHKLYMRTYQQDKNEGK